MRASTKISVTTLTLCLTLTVCLFLSGTAFAQRGISISKAAPSDRRVALVIGNARYKSSPLRNPVNDARLMARTLKGLGFEVIEGEDLSLRAMKRLVWDFGKRLDRGGVGLFYYAGHGVQVDGLNYLIPVDARIDSEHDVELEAFDVRRVLVEMREARNRLNLIFLDACRDNPYSRSFRSASTGLAQMRAPSGTLISFATGPGEAAADGPGKHGIFTEELARNITRPGLMVESALKLTRVAVSKRTGGKQIPWDSSSLTGNFYFKPGKTQVQPPVAPPTVQPAKPVQMAGGPDSQADQRKAEISRLLAEADALLDAGKLTTPKGANALERYNRVLFLQPLNRKADEGLKKIVGKYVDWAKSRLKAGDYAKAEQFLSRAEKVREGDERVLALLDELKKTKEEAESQNAKAEAERKERERKRRETAIVERSSDGRYTKAANGVITDSRTGLQWYVGPNNNTTLIDAKKWVNGLTVAGGGWRMPSLGELRGLHQDGKGSRNMAPIFKTNGWWVWSGETCGSSFACYFDFNFGKDSWGSTSYSDYDFRAFAVRSNAKNAATLNKATPERFTKDADGVITDSRTGLQWHVGPDKDTNWNDAKKWVEGLSVAGGGWRMPTRGELKGISQKGARGNANEYLPSIFKTLGWYVYVWSGEASGSSGAWLFNINSGKDDWSTRNFDNDSRAFAVRSALRAPTFLKPKPMGSSKKVSPKADRVIERSSDGRYTKAANGVITDNRTGLQWYVGIDGDTNWHDAKEWVEGLSVAGGGWRMPSRSELKGLYQEGKGSRNMDPFFETAGWWAWTGEICDASNAWEFPFYGGEEGCRDRTIDNNGRVFAVRSQR